MPVSRFRCGANVDFMSDMKTTSLLRSADRQLEIRKVPRQKPRRRWAPSCLMVAPKLFSKLGAKAGF